MTPTVGRTAIGSRAGYELDRQADGTGDAGYRLPRDRAGATGPLAGPSLWVTRFLSVVRSRVEYMYCLSA